MATTTKNYIKGAFANVRVNNFQNEEYKIDLSDESIEHLKTLPKNARGVRSIIVTKQKDPSKASVYENTFVPKGGDNADEMLPY